MEPHVANSALVKEFRTKSVRTQDNDIGSDHLRRFPIARSSLQYFFYELISDI